MCFAYTPTPGDPVATPGCVAEGPAASWIGEVFVTDQVLWLMCELGLVGKPVLFGRRRARVCSEGNAVVRRAKAATGLGLQPTARHFTGMSRYAAAEDAG
jgi:hypothetical protein